MPNWDLTRTGAREPVRSATTGSSPMKIPAVELIAQDIDARLSEGITTSTEDISIHILQHLPIERTLKLCQMIENDIRPLDGIPCPILDLARDIKSALEVPDEDTSR